MITVNDVKQKIDSLPSRDEKIAYLEGINELAAVITEKDPKEFEASKLASYVTKELNTQKAVKNKS